MESESDPSKRIKPNQHFEGFPSSSSTHNHESDPLLIPDFPNELVIEILSRLPAKSLGKFKCVSKRWLSLITTRDFIETHLAIVSGREEYGHHRLNFCVNSSDRQLHNELHSVNSLLREPTAEVSNFASPFDFTPLDWIVGSCNGLVCIYNARSRSFSLFNPCLNKLKILAHLYEDENRSKNYKIGYSWKDFGFGYDKLNDDYKVVGLYYTLNESLNGLFSCYYKIIVYSLKNNSWRKLEDLEIGVLKQGPPGDNNFKYASGKLHWPVTDGTYNWKIACFDLASETYGVMERPNKNECLRYHGLGVLRGCLSVFYEYERNHRDIWIMRDYGVEESWTKTYTVPYIDHPGEYAWIMCQSVCTLRNGEILVILNSHLLLYNPRTNTFRRFSQIGFLYSMVMYVESLVWPYIHDIEEAGSCIFTLR